jgi:hypothetical protein
MAQVINKVAVLRMLKTIESAVASETRSPTAVAARRDLAELVDFRDDPLNKAPNRVLQLSGEWVWGSVDVEPARAMPSTG